jgi:hypothetical protein
MGGGWLTPRTGRFTPRKETRYPLYRRLGGPQGRSGRVRKISPAPPWFVQPVASRYTDWAIPAAGIFQPNKQRTNCLAIPEFDRIPVLTTRLSILQKGLCLC